MGPNEVKEIAERTYKELRAKERREGREQALIEANKESTISGRVELLQAILEDLKLEYFPEAFSSYEEYRASPLAIEKEQLSEHIHGTKELIWTKQQVDAVKVLLDRNYAVGPIPELEGLKPLLEDPDFMETDSFKKEWLGKLKAMKARLAECRKKGIYLPCFSIEEDEKLKEGE